MASIPTPPLEEITWRSPQHLQMMGGFLHSNNILFYFAESPFFDPTSNNASLAVQASYNENFRPFIETREAFEGRLKTMQGLEFMVARDPLQEAAAAAAAASSKGIVTAGGIAPKEPSNVWVIRKQMRSKRGGGSETGSRTGDVVRILATYFIVGDSVFMAPSLSAVLGSRMLSTVTSLTNLLTTASSLLMFSPSYGHTYTPPEFKSVEQVSSSQQTSTSGGGVSASQKTQTTQASKPGTPMPSDNVSASGATTKSVTPSTTTASAQHTFEEAFVLFSQYGDEYMDESPLVGVPGSFRISKKQPSQQQQQQTQQSSAEKGLLPMPQVQLHRGRSSASATPAPLPSTPPTAAAIGTDAGSGGTVIFGREKGKGVEKKTPAPVDDRDKLREKKRKSNVGLAPL